MLANRRLTLAAIICLFAVLPLPPLHSQSREANTGTRAQQPAETANTPALRLETLLGLTPAEALAVLGAPEAVYPLRGAVSWQDNVVFYYSSHLYLFFFDNRVWQIRCDHRSTKTILGISAGMERAAVREILGTPYYSGDNEDIYLNPAGITRLRKGFPIRLRLIYDNNNNLHDIYLFRSDF